MPGPERLVEAPRAGSGPQPSGPATAQALVPTSNAAMARRFADPSLPADAYVAEALHRRLSPQGITLLGTVIGPVGDDESLVLSLRVWQSAHGIRPTGALDTGTEHSLVSELVARKDLAGAVSLVVDLYDIRTGPDPWVAREDPTLPRRLPAAVASVECGVGPTTLDASAMSMMAAHGEAYPTAETERHRMLLRPGSAPGPGSSPDQYASFVSTILHEAHHVQQCRPGRTSAEFEAHLPAEEFDAHSIEVFPYAAVPPLSPEARSEAVASALKKFDSMADGDRTPERRRMHARLQAERLRLAVRDGRFKPRPPSGGLELWHRDERADEARWLLAIFQQLPPDLRTPDLVDASRDLAAVAEGYNWICVP